MAREIIKSDEAPAAIGPYSQAVKANGFVFLSGQLALDPRTGQMVGQDIKTQTRRVLDNIKVVLKAAGSSLDKVVRCGVFLKDMNDFGPMNEEYGSYFRELPPARTTVQVAKLPRDGLIEIDVIAMLSGAVAYHCQRGTPSRSHRLLLQVQVLLLALLC